MATRGDNYQSTNVRLLEFIKGLNLLGENGILVANFFFRPIVFLNKASAAKLLLNSKENVEKSTVYYFGKLWLRNGLGTSEKTLWRDRRKKLAPTLHPKVTDAYLPVFVQCAKVLRGKLTRLSTGQDIDVLPLLSYCALDIICETTMGVQLEIQNNEDSEYLKGLQVINGFTIPRLRNIIYWPAWSFGMIPFGKRYLASLKYVKNFTTKIIEKRVSAIIEVKEQKSQQEETKHQKSGISFLDKLLELYFNEDGFGLEDVQDEVETALFGGHDTAALIMSWTLFLLGQNQECQRKMHEEMDTVFGSDNNAELELDDYKGLSYLDCIIKEAARLYEPAPLIARYLDEDLKLDDVTIPKGTECMVCIDAIHRDPDVYSDPEKFIPERWLPGEDTPPPNPYAFLAFSAGPRGCPGFRLAVLEMKVVLSTILKSFTVKSTLPRAKIIMAYESVQVPIGGLPVTFTPR